MGAQRSFRETFLAVLRIELCVSVFLYLQALLWVALFTERQGDAFAERAVGGHMGSIISAQLRVLPAYLIVALAYALVVTPVVFLARSRAPSRFGRTRFVARVLCVDVLACLASVGPFFSQNPGLLDGVARKTAPFAPGLDLYVLYRWHLLDGATLVFAFFLGLAAFTIASEVANAVSKSTRTALGLCAFGLPVVVLLVAALPPLRGRSGATPTRPNILVIASDSLRYDRLGVHGHSRADISPNIDAFSREALDFQQMHVATASTLESWMSFMSGQFPPTHGVRYMYLRREQAEAVGLRRDLLPRVLAEAGYQTIVSSNWAGNCFKLVDVGFEDTLASDVQNFEALIMEATIWSHLVFPLYFTNGLGDLLLPEVQRITSYVRPSVLTDRLFDRIDGDASDSRPFFGLLFFSMTHLPYQASHPFNLKYMDPEYSGPHRYQIDVKVHDLITTGFAPTLPPEVISHIRDLYDGAVSEFDAAVGETLEALRVRGLDRDTLVIVTSDHGEDLYDPGSTLGHGTNFFGGDQSTRIPFFLRLPTSDGKPGFVRSGEAVEALTRNVDVLPTLLDFLKLEDKSPRDGRSLMPLILGLVKDLDLLAFAETCYLFFPKTKAMVDLSEEERAEVFEVPGAIDTLDVDPNFDNNLILREELHGPVLRAKDRMVRSRRFKLIEIPGKTRPIDRLYDLATDPAQQRDLSKLNLPIMATLKAAMRAYDEGRASTVRLSAEEDRGTP